MICPKCGAKIEEGMLLCGRCGCEIKYVPDFDPEIENSIQASLPDVAAVMNSDADDSGDVLDPELLARFGLDEDLNSRPTQEIPVTEVKKRIPTQEMPASSGRKSSQNSGKPVRKDGSLAGRPVNPARKSADGEKRNPEGRKTANGERRTPEGERKATDGERRISAAERRTAEGRKASEGRTDGTRKADGTRKSADGRRSAEENKSGENGSRRGGKNSAPKPSRANVEIKASQRDELKKKRPKRDYDDFDDDFEDDFADDFWDVEEALDFTGTGRLFDTIKNNLFAKIVAIGAIVIALGIIISLVVFVAGRVKRNTFQYKFDQAQIAFENGDYAHAVSYMESAASMHSDDLTAQYLLAEYYQKNNQTQNAILTYRNIIRDFDTDVNVAYSKLFAIYESQGDFESINMVLSECKNPAIISQFQQYLADEPEFSMDPGSYDDPIYLKITANPSGKIYYTLDGSTPDNESEQYTTPLYLEKGAFHLRAIYINTFGLMSTIAEGDFQINVAQPDPPQINLDSDEYDTPEMICVVDIPEDCMVYYTSDGTEPTKDSNVYKNPILMPLGSSTFQFVTYNFDDVPSEITSREYLYLADQETVTAAVAANVITEYRFSQGGMNSTDGQLTYLSGRLLFMCEAAIMIHDTPYYVINEYYQDPNSGTTMKTGLMYAVSMKDETDYGTLKLDGNGNYVYVRS